MSKEQYKKVTISLPLKIFEEYQEFCKREGMNLSSRIAILLKKDLENKK